MGTISDSIKQALQGIIQAKAQLTESGDVNISIDIGNHYYPQTLPQDVIVKIQSSGVTPEQKTLIEEEAEQRLSAKRLNIDSLPEPERNKLIAGVTTEATAHILVNDTIHVTEDFKISISKPSTGEAEE
jgi:hypothetical protein